MWGMWKSFLIDRSHHLAPVFSTQYFQNWVMPQYLYFVLCTSLHSWYASQLWYSRQAGVVRSSDILVGVKSCIWINITPSFYEAAPLGWACAHFKGPSRRGFLFGQKNVNFGPPYLYHINQKLYHICSTCDTQFIHTTFVVHIIPFRILCRQ